ncbi:MAG: transglutaminase-like domain-containing protein, partial [Hydrogenophaga sp.]|nr:transglutaminase-like domain-containing protein [Hydrogenophaga sp.]
GDISKAQHCRAEVWLSGFGWVPVDNTVRLTDVRLENMDLPDASPANAARFKRLGGALVQGLLPDLVVHRLKPEDLEAVGRRGYQPGALRVVPGGLELQLDPLPR